MAGDWMKVELSTPEKPEIFAIAQALEIDPDEAFGKVFRVWSWFNEHTSDGYARSVTGKHLDRLVGVPGIAEEMQKNGWLGVRKGGIFLPNFGFHNGSTAKKRALSAKRMQRKRDADSVTSAPPIAQPDLDLEREKEIPPPPTPSAIKWRDGIGWEAVVEDLISLGVAKAREAVDSCKRFECPLDLVEACIEHYRQAPPGSWSPGALYNRLVLLRPDQDPSHQWPKLAMAGRAEQQRQEQQAKQQQQAEAEAQRQAEKKHSQEYCAKLEKQHGDELDALDKQGVIDLIRHAYPDDRFVVQQYQRRGLTTTIRFSLLDHLHRSTVKT